MAESPPAPPSAPAPAFTLRREEGALHLVFTGEWRMGSVLPDLAPAREALEAQPRPERLAYDTAGLLGWDSRFLAAVLAITAMAAAAGVAADNAGLPHGAAVLLDLAAKVPERKGAARVEVSAHFLERVGETALSFGRAMSELLEFLGAAALALWSLVRGKAFFQKSTFGYLIQQCGADALPIVSLINLLVGLILAFVGAIQLTTFGAQIYVSTLVGIAMVRVMAAVMTGIIMAGRTGAAFAAELGAMKVNEEIDALTTLGFSPMEFLVLPRMLAVTLMMPLLCVYADLMGILGGFIVGVFMLKLNPILYLTHTWNSVSLTHFWIGMTHSLVFGVLIGLAGCWQGMRCGKSALAVGQATTSAVVTSILAIVIATAIITVVCNILGI